MKLHKYIGNRAAYARTRPLFTVPELRAINRCRQQWLDALLLDQTRAWLDLGERQPEVLQGLAVLLTLGHLADGYEAGDGSVERRKSMATAMGRAQDAAAQRGCVLTAEDADVLHAGVMAAHAAIKQARPAALMHAAECLRADVGLPS